MTVEMELEPRTGRPGPQVILQLRLHAVALQPHFPRPLLPPKIVSGEGLTHADAGTRASRHGLF